MTSRLILKAAHAAVLIAVIAPASAQEPPEIAGKMSFSCVDQARDSAGTWRNACVEIGGSQQECRIEARAIYEFVLSQCFSNLDPLASTRAFR